jgi:(p)ppGpp synthase/HD superfamily hydrolase
MSTSAPLSRLATTAHPTVAKALDFAEKHLHQIKRRSGEDYCTHVTEVAATLEEVIQDDTLTAVAILHDLPMHPDGAALLEQSPLSDEQRELVRGMHKLRRLHIDMNTGDLDRMIGAFADDSRLLLLRMAHRLNDVRHMDRFPAKRRKEMAHETLTMYTAVSGRLGFHRWRWQMEDICFMELQPRASKNMKKYFDASRAIDEECLRHASSFLRGKLGEHGIEADIDERIKGLYSTYRKMVLKNLSFDKLTDRLALRILVNNKEDCYRALGVIHASMRPMHGKLKDYIGTPKENGYQSIHTVVYPLPGISELPIEIQIRTREMHKECEFGIASHGSYKHWRYTLSSPQSRVNLFRNLESLHGVIRSHHTFTQALKRSFNDNKLLIFDPQNNVYHIDKPASALDFGCQMYPDKCRAIRGVRINGREHELGTLLKDGDIVELIVGTKAVPMKEHIEAAQQKATKVLIRKSWGEAKQASKKHMTASYC